MKSTMKQHVLLFCNGDALPLFELDDGTFACPICGTPWPYPPRVPSGGANGLSSPALGDVCDGCDVEFGVEEGCGSEAPRGWMSRQYAEYRTQWLDRGGWQENQLRQLEQNLQLTRTQVRADAERLAKGMWKLE